MNAFLLSREQKLEDALQFAVSVIANAREATTADPAVWQQVMKDALDVAHEALYWNGAVIRTGEDTQS